MSNQVYSKYLEQALGKSPNESNMVALSGNEAMEAIWPLNEVFRPYIQRIAVFPYEANYENEADDALEAFVFSGDDWAGLSAQAWRVLLERHHQAIILFQLNENEPVIPIPEELAAEHYTNVVLLFVLHQWKLPFPPVDRSDLAKTSGTVPGSITPQ